jgi:hypothetical protein
VSDAIVTRKASRAHIIDADAANAGGKIRYRIRGFENRT